MSQLQKNLLKEVGIALAIILPLLVGVFFFSSQIERFGSEISAARRDLFSRATALGELASLREDYNNKAKRGLESLYAVIPVKDQLINLARDFQSISSQTQLSSSFSFAGETPPAGGALGHLSFSLDLRGKLENFFAFVAKFERFRYLSLLTSFSISRGVETSEMMTRGNVYYR